MTIVELTTFFGWMAAINIGLLLFSTTFLVFCKNFALNMHNKLFGLEKTEINKIYFQYIAHYKILTITFSLVPYIALKLMA